ncbi:MAG TPA: hypothetical protein V6D19_13645 [Stenomitos sp.]
MELLLGGIIGALLSLIVTAVFLPMIQDPVTDFFATKFGNSFGPRRAGTLAGKWRQDWQIDGRPRVDHPDAKLELTQLGKSLVGSFTYDGRPYRLRARIENNTFVSGTWFDHAAGQTYHGTFQARIEIDQNRVEGKWIGFSKNLSTFNTGSWTWFRDTQ